MSGMGNSGKGGATVRRTGWVAAMCLAAAWAALAVPGARGDGQALEPFYSISGRVSCSVDGAGSNNAAHLLSAYKPNSEATVLRAFLIAVTIPSGGTIANGALTIDGKGVQWQRSMVGVFNIRNYLADVTSLVKTKIDNAAPGYVNFNVHEPSDSAVRIDGEVFAVVFDDPAWAGDRTVALLFGAQRPIGDTFTISLAEPIDPLETTARADMGLGISWSRGDTQRSLVEVQGLRMSSAAGGYDDGSNANGAYLTCGGLGDNVANPPDPLAQGPSNYDDELYSLLPYIDASTSVISVWTYNPSNDDNIFFAYFHLSAAAIISQRITLAPPAADREIGDEHVLTATVQDFYGVPIVGTTVTFDVQQGPNSAQGGTAVTDAAGQAVWSYVGDAGEGTDLVVARFTDAAGDVIYSNIVTCRWTLAEAPPECVAGGPYSGWVNVPVQLSGTGSTDPQNNIALYAWDLDGDGQYDDATGPTVNWTFHQPGAFTVGLRVCDAMQLEDTCTATVNIGNHAPVAVPGGPYTGPAGGSVTLSGAGSHDQDVGDAISAYAWDFDGDGQFDDAAGVSPSFPVPASAPGTVFSVCLRVTDSFGATHSACTTVTVGNRAPQASAGGPYAAACAGPVTGLALSGSGSDPDPGDVIATWAWTTNCAGATFSPSAAVPNPTLMLPSGATCSVNCTVTLRVTDSHNQLSAPSTATVSVTDTAAPEFTNFPPDLNVPCPSTADPNSTGRPTASDTCGTATVTYTDQVQAGSCAGTRTITRTWRAVDGCNNARTRAQVIAVVDQTAPQFNTFPPDRTVQCGASTAPSAMGTPTGSDACSTATLTYSDVLSAACGQSGTLTRTWRLVDACGNVNTRDQVITIQDTTAPQFTWSPPNATVECPGDTSPAATGTPQVQDACGAVELTYEDAFAPGCGVTGIITRTWRAEDACGNVTTRGQQITVRDTVGPAFTVAPADVTYECGAGYDEDVAAWLASAAAVDACGGAVVTHNYQGAPGVGSVLVTWTATDDCGRQTQHTARLTIEDNVGPELTCPPDAEFVIGSSLCSADVQGWLDSAVAVDACDANAPTITNDAPPCGLPAGTTVVTWTATDSSGNTTQCSAVATVGESGRADASLKGSVLVFPAVEVKWDAAGNVVQDTFLTIQNDYLAPVRVEIVFVNGDPAIPGSPGCNRIRTRITLTPSQPAYFSALTGEPLNLPAFAQLDPGSPPGRLDPDDPLGQRRTVRGFVVAWAINAAGHEIRWNHLAGAATVVDYAGRDAWEYTPWSFRSQCVEHGEEPEDCVDGNGTGCCAAMPIPGRLDFDGFQYDMGPEYLLLDFRAVGPMLVPGGWQLNNDADLTLFILDQDFRQEGGPPVTTIVTRLWDQDEDSFSDPPRCVDCWSQKLLSALGGHFLQAQLQTDYGRAALQGDADPLCPGSADVPLLGVVNRIVTYGAGQKAETGATLTVSGHRTGQILYDVP